MYTVHNLRHVVFKMRHVVSLRTFDIVLQISVGWFVYICVFINKLYIFIYHYTGCPFNLDNFQIAVTLLLFGIFPICKKNGVKKIWTFCCIQWKYTILILILPVNIYYIPPTYRTPIAPTPHTKCKKISIAHIFDLPEWIKPCDIIFSKGMTPSFQIYIFYFSISPGRGNNWRVKSNKFKNILYFLA